MAERIEGLSIELDLETMKINSGLKDLKSQLTTVNSEMKANMSAFDRSDKSIGKYETRLQGLNKKLEVQQAVTEKAYTSYEKLVKEHGEGSTEAQKAAKEYNNQVASLNNLSRYVERVENDLSQLREEQRVANSNWAKMGDQLDKAGTKLKSFGDKASGIGNSLSTTLTPAVLGMGTAMGLVASSYEDSTVRIQNSLGLTAAEAKELTDISRNIYKNGFGESADEIDNALLQTKQNIKDLNNEDLERITEKAFLLGETFEADVNEVTRAGNNVMKGFGLEADEAFDLMAKGAQNGLNFSNEMFDNLSEYSTLFGNMGYSAEEYFELLQKGTEAGVYNLDYINDIMKEFQIRVKDGSKTTSEAMGLLSKDTQGVWKEFEKGDKTVKDVSNAVLKELEGMDDQVAANQIGVELFGTKFEDLEADAVYSLGGIGEGLEDVDGTMDDMTKNAERSISKQWKATWREAKEVLLPVGETLLDFTQDVLPDVKDGIEDVTEWFEELDEEGKKNIIMLGGIAAAAGPVLSVVGSLSSGVGGLMKVTGGLSKVLGITGGKGLLGRIGLMGITGGPVGLAVAGVAGLGVGIYNLTKDSEELNDVNFEVVRQMGEEIEATDNLINRFDDLQEANKLTKDEMLEYMDVLAELEQTTSPDKVKELTDRQNDLLEKSGFTNEKMNEFLELNDEVIEQAPNTAKAISSEGDAFAENTEAIKKLNEEKRKEREVTARSELTKALENEKQLIKDKKEDIKNINDFEKELDELYRQRPSVIQNVQTEQEKLSQLEEELNVIAEKGAGLGSEKWTLKQKEVLEQETILLNAEAEKNIIKNTIEDLESKYSASQENLESVREQKQATEELLLEYEQLIISELDINAEKGKGLSAIEKQIQKRKDEKTELEKIGLQSGNNTFEYQEQVKNVEAQINKLEDAKEELKLINQEAGKTIYQDHNVSVKFHARYSGFKQGDSANIGLVGGGGHVRQYATGTDHHPGGRFLAGEEGFELGRLGNQWEMLDLGMYNRPSGYQVFTHDESKNIMKAFNNMPGYATGISTVGEADRIVSSMRNNPFNQLLALLGKESNSNSQVSNNNNHTTVINSNNDSKHLESMVDKLSEQAQDTKEIVVLLSQLLMKNSNIVMNEREVGRILEPMITEVQIRKEKTRKMFRGS